MHHGLTLPQLLAAVWSQPGSWRDLSWRLAEASGIGEVYGTRAGAVTMCALVVAGLATGWALPRVGPAVVPTARALRLPLVFALLGACLHAVLFVPPLDPQPWIALVPLALLVGTATAAAARWFCGPERVRLADRVMVAVWAGVLAALLAVVGDRFAADDPLFALARLVAEVLTGLAVGGVLGQLGRLASDAGVAALWRLVALALPGLVVLLEVLGRPAPARQALGGALGTLLLVPVWQMARRLVAAALDGVESGRWRWVGWARQRLELGAGPLPGWEWFRFGCEALLIGGGLLLLGSVWWSPELAWRWLVQGFGSGRARVVPWHGLEGLLVFCWLVAAGRLGAAVTDVHLRRQARLDAGAQAAVVAVVRYTTWIGAALAGLGLVMGSLRDITVIAGALSVGVGFGLQAIVNNFVSGLILLFERPVQVGDWIKVGASEGRVRRITVRHTEIETAGRAAVVVPNSDLLSQHVLNETRHNRDTRLELVIKMAPETSPDAFRELVLAVAREHPQVVTNADLPPTVLYRAASDTGLEFALWCVIRDVERRPFVLSELLYALEPRLLAAGLKRGH